MIYSFLDTATRQNQHTTSGEDAPLTTLTFYPSANKFVSTTGDAEQSSSIENTWNKLLSKSLTNTLFANVTFALFALGDRAYGPDAFCAAGRKLAARLVQLGATVVCGLGFGDDGSFVGPCHCQ